MAIETSAAEVLDRQRKAALQAEIGRYVGHGYRVVSQSDYAAQMLKPKGFSFKWLLLWMLVTIWSAAILGAVIYLVWYWTRKDSQVYLTVDEEGKIRRK